MIPRILGRMLMGKAPEESRRRRSRPLPQWVVPQGLSLAQGSFEIVDETSAPAPPPTSRALSLPGDTGERP